MSEGLMLPLLEGTLLGAIFFGGLWWTIRKGIASQRPARWFFSSLLLRTSITVTGLYVFSGGHWERLLVCLFGFTLVRPIIARLTEVAEKAIQPDTGANPCA